MSNDLTDRLADRLKTLRRSRQWSLDQLAKLSGVSRATLSRLENAEVSPTAEVLGKLCAVYELQMSRLLMMIEDGFSAHVPFVDQPEWSDPSTGFSRRSVSPPDHALSAEVLECHLPVNTRIPYDTPPKPGLEHHLIMLDGALTLTVGETVHNLTGGDCLRYQLFGASAFETGPNRGARYMLVVV
jgi:transcriptional regulator with XRE-family HTH domain